MRNEFTYELDPDLKPLTKKEKKAYRKAVAQGLNNAALATAIFTEAATRMKKLYEAIKDCDHEDLLANEPAVARQEIINLAHSDFDLELHAVLRNAKATVRRAQERARLGRAAQRMGVKP